MYNPAFFERLCPVLNDCIPDFDSRDFIFRVFNNAWPDMELKERVRHISKALHHFLPADFAAAAQQLISISQALRKKDLAEHGYENIFLADYIETFGGQHPVQSQAALNEVRKTIAAQFATESFVTDEGSLPARSRLS